MLINFINKWLNITKTLKSQMLLSEKNTNYKKIAANKLAAFIISIYI